MKAKGWIGARVCAVAVAGCLALPTLAGAAAPGTPTSVVMGKNFIVNGDFSVPVVTSGVWNDYAAGNSAIKGWTIGGNSVDVVGPKYWQEPPGYKQAIDLSGYNSGSLTQSVPTQAGWQYLLGWWASANPNSGLAVRVMHVLWDGKLVDTLNINLKGHSSQAMQWAHKTFVLTATSASSTLTFADATPNNGGCGAALGGVTLNAETISENVNGFKVQESGAPVPLSGPYGLAEVRMLAKVPATATVTTQGRPVAALTAASASQSPAGTGLVITLSEAPTSSFLEGSSAQQSAGASAMLKYLSTLLSSSYSAYQAALQAERIPLGPTLPLTKSWGVRIEAVSTTGKLMTFEVAQANPTTGAFTYSETGVSAFSGRLTAATASAAIRDMLYYTKGVVAASGPTATTSTS